MEEWRHDQKIVLSSGERQFQIKYAPPQSVFNDPVFTSFKIKGIHESWQRTQNHEILLADLPFGNYNLLIRSQNVSGEVLDILSIPINSLRPFYLRWWFILTMLLIVALLAYAYNQWRTLKLRRQKQLLEKEVQERTHQILEDKTIIEQQAQKLQELDEMKSRFFTNVSHELRTPLTLILSPLKSVLKNRLLEEKDRRYIETAHQSGQQLLELTNEILDINKLEAGKMTLEESPVRLMGFLNRIISKFESHAQQKGIQFSFTNSIPSDFSSLLDTGKMEKILNNLIINALKYTSENGKIILQAQVNQENILFEIHDNGQGIHQEDISHIFNRFYQSRQKESLAKGGTGIGLALCKELIQLMGGSINVKSEWGKGTSFFLKFPNKPTVNITSSKNQESNFTSFSNVTTKSPIPTRSKIEASVLVVEDHPILQQYLLELLSDQYHVTLMSNGAEAVNYLSALEEDDHLPNIIISDLMMPVMDGYELLERLKSHSQWQQIPTIMLTARTNIKDKLKALRIGVDDYIVKPFIEEELKVRIQNLLTFSKQRVSFKEEVTTGSQNLAGFSEPEPELSPIDNKWLTKIEELTLQNIQYFDFNNQRLADLVFLSRRQLDRRLKKLTGLTTGEYIREARLQKARHMLESGTYSSIKEVTLSIGLKSSSHFSKQFKERFGILPSDTMD